MKLKVSILVVLLFTTVFVFAQSNDDEKLKSLVKEMSAAQANFQAEALDKIFTEDFVEISPVGEVDPREKVLGFYKPESKPPAGKISVEIEADEFSIRNYGDFAIIIARLNYKMTNEGKPLPPRSIRTTLVCRRENDVWKIASAHYTGIRPLQNAPQASNTSE